jgi:D-3-phosphoglycerate dehydrogenase / 2-oxoglutarate reductase
MAFKVVNIFPMPDTDFGEDLLQSTDIELVNQKAMTEDEIIAVAHDADAIIGIVSVHPFTRRLLSALPKCRVIAGVGIGYDTSDVQAGADLGIPITNVPDYCLDEVSGLAITLMMALWHKLLPLDKAVREHRVLFTQDRKALDRFAAPIFRMRDQTLGVVGVGKIGTVTALKAKGLGMRVLGCDPYVLQPVMESRGVKPVDFNTLLAESDFITTHTVLNAETNKIWGYEQFKRMKRTAYFINTSRGGVVDQEGLIRALKEGLIAGAGLDVTLDEPPAADNPLLTMSNVILTGHSAWYSVPADLDLHRRPMTQVLEALNGQWPTYALNPEGKAKWMARWGKKG